MLNTSNRHYANRKSGNEIVDRAYIEARRLRPRILEPLTKDEMKELELYLVGKKLMVMNPQVLEDSKEEK